MSFEHLAIEIDGAVARLRMTRPELMNRVDEPCHRELIEAFRILAHDRAIRAVVWSAGGRVFSAGGDLNEIYSQTADIDRRIEMALQARELIYGLLDIPAPVIVALHGHAYGLAATLLMLCDAVVAVPEARIADTHVKVGLVAGDGGIVGWPSAISLMRAKYHLLTGEPLTAKDAYGLGMVTKLAETPEACWKTAESLARQIAALPPIAVQGTKKTFNALLRARADEVLELGLAYEQGSLTTADLVEAVEAFREKREPVYHGH
ncbi:MAG TPA: enoyl-CoA hydratase/isomerase family protein [Stellaceae bacterium]|nr:enoyl-CoA hydratase/isomerase family protein [Stellaceae bacterium]